MHTLRVHQINTTDSREHAAHRDSDPALTAKLLDAVRILQEILSLQGQDDEVEARERVTIWTIVVLSIIKYYK